MRPRINSLAAAGAQSRVMLLLLMAATAATCASALPTNARGQHGGSLAIRSGLWHYAVLAEDGESTEVGVASAASGWSWPLAAAFVKGRFTLDCKALALPAPDSFMCATCCRETCLPFACRRLCGRRFPETAALPRRLRMPSSAGRWQSCLSLGREATCAACWPPSQGWMQCTTPTASWMAVAAMPPAPSTASWLWTPVGKLWLLLHLLGPPFPKVGSKRQEKRGQSSGSGRRRSAPPSPPAKLTGNW